MITCPECSADNQSNARFCSNCGAYLDWDALERSTTPDPVVGPLLPDPTPENRGGPVTVTPPAPAPEDQSEPRGDQTRHRPTVPDDAGAAPSRSRSPQLRLPGEEAPPPLPAPVAGEVPTVGVGGVVCRHCGIGNGPKLTFCRSCGGTLAAPSSSVPSQVIPDLIPWYRRPFSYQIEDHMPAGNRPQKLASEHRQRWHRVIALVAVLAAAVVLAAAGWRYCSSVVAMGEQVVDRVVGIAAVKPGKTEVSSRMRGHPAANLVDPWNNTWWEPASGKTAEPHTATFTFDEPLRLVQISITPGISADSTVFKTAGRPKKIQIVVISKDGGKLVERPWDLHDQAGAQPLHLGVNDVKTVQLLVTDVYDDKAEPPVAIAAVEFFTRK